MESLRFLSPQVDASAVINLPLEFNFQGGSANSASAIAYVTGTLANFDHGNNIDTWSISRDGQTLASNLSPVPFSVTQGDVLQLTITRFNNANPAVFHARYHIRNNTEQNINLLDYSLLGGNSRYLYALTSKNLYCIDTNLLSLGNLKTITSVVNNGASLTLTCNGHGFANGNVISLIDVGGFSTDINHRPWSISNVTVNTFDITTTVTGAWDGIGYLSGAWITNPIIATLLMPDNGNTNWRTLTYRDRDKTLYAWAELDLSRKGAVCSIVTDDLDASFNVVKNWDKSATNAYTQFTSAAGPAASFSVYDPVNDRFYHLGVNTNPAGIYFFPFGPTLVYNNVNSSYTTINGGGHACFSYNSAVYITDTITQKFAWDSKILGFFNDAGQQDGRSIYSFKSNKIWAKHNSGGVKRFSADKGLSIDFALNNTIQSWQGAGCSVNSLDKVYMFRTNQSVSYPGTYDLYIWDETSNLVGDMESTHIACWSGSTVFKAQYSHYSGKVIAAESSRLQIFDTTRPVGKKYIGYVQLSQVISDIAMNNLLYL